ncbi:MAG: oligosaccharide flippase family protein [Bacteroidota bacterium]
MADKTLPVVYGVAYVLLVIRALPQEEFGNFVLIQEIFLISTGLAMGFALQPLLKYAAESREDTAGIVTASLLFNLAFTALCSLVIVLFRAPLSAILNSPTLEPLLLYLPAMFAASFIRNKALILLQTRFRIREVFWVDAAHFLGAPLLIWVSSRMHMFNSARDLIIINIISLSASSLVGLLHARSMMRLTLKPPRADILRIWDYGKFSLGGIFSYLVYTKVDSFILSAVTGPVQVAVYNSVKIFTRIYDMVNQVIQMFVLPAVSRLSSEKRHESLKALVEKAIAFSTIAMVPVFLFLLMLAEPMIDILYAGKYNEAVPLLRILSILTLVVPLIAVASNTLMGLGQARVSFVLAVQILVTSVVIYLVLIPLLGALGAAIGYVLSAAVLAWITTAKMDRFVHITPAEVFRRKDDIGRFLRKRLNRGNK